MGIVEYELVQKWQCDIHAGKAKGLGTMLTTDQQEDFDSINKCFMSNVSGLL
jgi:hypothetical protein